MQGFKQFFVEGELAPISPISGMAELSRLERGHYFFTSPMDRNSAWDFIKGHLTSADFEEFIPADTAKIEQQMSKLKPEKDSLLMVCFPKRWEKSLGRQKIQETFGKMIGWSKLSAQYVWGSYSLWNPQTEEMDEGNFFRNPHYHANDDLLDEWLKKNPKVVKEKDAVPVNRQPRVMGWHLLDQGRHSFHGYREPNLPEPDQSSGIK